MDISASAIICAVRNHGETGAIVRGFTAEYGILAGYVAGARGRQLRPVLIPGNVIKGEWRTRIAGQLARLTPELEHSRAHLLSEPLAIAAIDWVTALTAATLAEGVPYLRIHSAADGLLSAIELAPAARVWAGAVAQYETLLLAELGYAEEQDNDNAPVAMMAQTRKRLVAHVLGDRRADVMAARERLVERLKRAAV
ncbi:recombination protein O N-terminal domain-containing protein [Sphingorhabdus sp. EL138]|jgi:DNA repair protein RecO (recombination protein O)|uniref:DNA repair protein RecO n=1 Tax=Sphingorhabdus sp. EL138 TaxID=2073156 RepID=UPI0025FD6555|nr:recombination protein O N-terminal domain-containing protein [Sphingorhabdus sp. EL138]